MLPVRCWCFTLRNQVKKFKTYTLSLSSESGGREGERSCCPGGWEKVGWVVCYPIHHHTLILPIYLSPPSPPPLWISPPLLPLWIYHYFFPAAISYRKSIWNERQLQCCVLIPFLTSFDFKFEWLSRTNKFLLTSSIVSGSDADASHLLFRMKMFGLERRWFTFRKNFFSCKWQGSNEKLHKHGKVTSMNATTLDKFVL